MQVLFCLGNRFISTVYPFPVERLHSYFLHGRYLLSQQGACWLGVIILVFPAYNFAWFSVIMWDCVLNLVLLWFHVKGPANDLSTVTASEQCSKWLSEQNFM